jgi:hypothetical protein
MSNTYTATSKALITRYGGWIVFLGSLVLFTIFRPLIDNRITHEEFLNALLFKDIIIPIYFGLFMVFFHINIYLAAHNYTKKLIISDSSATFYLFNFFKYKKIEIKYSDIETLENKKYATIFTFTLKSGKKKDIHATVKNRTEALAFIQKRIKESNLSK